MLNQYVVVGRLVEEPAKNEEKGITVKLAVQRSYKNLEGEYEVDYIPITLFNSIKDNVNEYCKKGDLLGVKGRIQTENEKIIIIADKVTFLSSRKENE